MNRESTTKSHVNYLLLLAVTALFAGNPALAQVPVDENGKPLASIDGEVLTQADPVYQEFDIEAVEQLTPAELRELIGPIALYPDDLLAIVLPASTYPLEIVQAARFLESLKTDSSLKPNENWDESVTALLNYPEVVNMLNDDIDWTWKLGEAVVRQQQDVIAAVEDFRDRAYAAGNLKTDDRQTVTRDEGVIEIVPIDEEIIHVPYYEPERVLVSQVQPVYHYYPRAYPVYYYPYPYGHSFGSGYFWGVTTAFRIGWATDYLHVHHHSYWGHPYYGRSYFGNHYRRPSIDVYNNYYVNNRARNSGNRYRDGDYWRPRTYGGARPGYHSSRTQSYRRTDVARPASTRSGTSRHASTNTRDAVRTSTQRTTSREDISFRNRDQQRGGSRQSTDRPTATRTTATTTRTVARTSDQRRTDRDNIAFRSRDQRQTVGRPTSTATRTTLASTNRTRQPVTTTGRERTAASPVRNDSRTTTSNRVHRQTPSNSERRASPTPARETRQVNRRSDSSPSRSPSSQRASSGSASRPASGNSASRSTGSNTRSKSNDSSSRQRRH